MGIQGVIFDMDGLMFDIEPMWDACWAKVFEEQEAQMPEGLAEALRGLSEEAVFETLRRFLGAHTPCEFLWERERELMVELVAERGVPMKPGLLDLLTYLNDCQLPMAVVSSSAKPMMEANLARANIAGYFDVIVSGARLSANMPESDVFLEASTLLGTAPARTVVLEDSSEGVEAGLRGGFITIMVPGLDMPTPRQPRGCAAVVDNLADVIDLIEEGRLGG